ncbi:MAG: carboxypeptidase-like regulatory domain-containing protein, partial [Bacteroidota bacterium]
MNKIFYILLFTAFLGTSKTHAQEPQMAVSGKVTDAANGSALPGVTIRVEGKNAGTISDADGGYALK